MSKATAAVVEWDVRDGKVYRDDRAVVAFHDYNLAHPDGMTVQQWEARKARQVLALGATR